MILRLLLTLIGSYLAYYLFNWHFAVWTGLPCVTLPWFIILGLVIEVVGNFSYYKSPKPKNIKL